MIAAVVLALALVAPSLSLPLSESAGFQGQQIGEGSLGLIGEAATTGEKAGVGGVSQIGEGSVVEQSGTKAGGEVLSGVGQSVQRPVHSQVEGLSQGYSGAPVQYSGVETVGQKTGVQTVSEGYASQQYPENYPQQAVPKVENVPVEHKQPTQGPLLLPVQPLTVVPVNQVGEILRPVVVPEEAIAAGRVIIMAIEPIQQRNFQEVTPEKQVPYQQVVQPVSQVQAQGVQQGSQPLFVQPVQKQEPQTVGQTYIPVQVQPEQVPFVREQAVYNPNVVQQGVEPVHTYNPAEHHSHVYNAQPSQVAHEYVEKQVPQQPVGYTQGQTQHVERTQQQSQTVQQIGEKQGEYQQVSDYTPVQNQGVQTLYQQQVNPVPVEAVQQHQQYHQQVEQQQPTERQAPFQQISEYIPVQQTFVQPQTYNVQPEYQQNYDPLQPQPAQQQVYNVQPEYQQNYTPVQPHTPQHTEGVHQTSEKQGSHQQHIQTGQYIHPQPEEPTYQQQVSSVQPFAATHVETHAPNQAVQQESNVYAPEYQQKTESQQVVGYGPEPVYHFGDRIPQKPSVQQGSSVHVLSAVAQNPGQPVSPSVVAPQA